MEKIEITISEFKSHLSEQISKVENEGAEIHITRHGKSVAKLVTTEKKPKLTMADHMGSLAGTVVYQADDLFEDDGWADEWEMNQE